MSKKYKQAFKGRLNRLNKVDLSKLHPELINCSNLITKALNNANYLLKQNKSNFNKVIVYYKQFGINLSKAYISELKSGKTKTCNILILQFIASYLNIPLIELLTNDYTLTGNIKQVKQDASINEF